MRTISPDIKKRFPKKRLYVSLALAVLLVVCDYLIANFTFPVLNSADDYHLTSYLNSFFIKKDTVNPFDHVVCVNMAMEKELVDITDDFGDLMGNAAVTSRDMLDTVVNLAREAGASGILVDIRFSDGLKAPGDSVLFADMARTEGLVVSRHREEDYGKTPDAIISRTAMADYRGQKGAGFSRYELLQDDSRSVAAEMWRHSSGHRITRFGPLYFDNGRLCYNCPFITFPMTAASGITEEGEILYPYLRSQLLNAYSRDELLAMMKGKTVMIGDFDNDVHDTYVGSVPGPMLSYFAYDTLRRGDHLVKILPQLLLLIIYWVMIFSILSPSSITFSGKGKKWMQVMMLGAEFLGYGGALALIDCLYFNIWHVNLLTALPANLIFLLLLVRRITLTVSGNNSESSEKSEKSENSDNSDNPDTKIKKKYEKIPDNNSSQRGGLAAGDSDRLPDSEADHPDNPDRQLQV